MGSRHGRLASGNARLATAPGKGTSHDPRLPPLWGRGAGRPRAGCAGSPSPAGRPPPRETTSQQR